MLEKLAEAEIRQACRQRLEALEQWLRRLVHDELSKLSSDYLSALEYLLRCAVMVGKKEAGAIVKAKRARQLYNTAVIEVRRSERHSGRGSRSTRLHH